MKEGLNKTQWIQWSVATAIAGMVGILGFMTLGYSVVYPRDRGELLEKRADRFEDQILNRLDSLDKKIDGLRSDIHRTYLKK